jgi:hypothetical protein
MQKRQGDVFMQQHPIPSGAASVPRDADGRILLAQSKATGHHHETRTPGVEAFLLDAVLYLSVGDEPAHIHHPEHNPPGSPMILDAGTTWRITHHHEYEPGELPRQVED